MNKLTLVSGVALAGLALVAVPVHGHDRPLPTGPSVSRAGSGFRPVLNRSSFGNRGSFGPRIDGRRFDSPSAVSRFQPRRFDNANTGLRNRSGSASRWANHEGTRWARHRGGRWRERHADWHGRHAQWHNENPNQGGDWRARHRGWHRDHGRHRDWHRRHVPRYYYTSYYPWGWYGYPYYGASASLYYDGYYGDYYGHGSSYGGSGNLIASVQQELAQAGYYRGAIDGVIGPRTRSAIRAFERANGLPVDGRIDQDLLATLGVAQA